MPAPADLKAEILSGPLAAELAAPWAAGDNEAVAAALNRADQPGYVPARWVVVTLATFPSVDGLRRWVLTFGTLPAEMGGGAAPLSLYCLFQNLDRPAQSVGDKGDLRSGVDRLRAGLSQASQAGLVAVTDPDPSKPIPAAFGPYLLSGETKLSRAQVAWGLDARVSIDDVRAARNA